VSGGSSVNTSLDRSARIFSRSHSADPIFEVEFFAIWLVVEISTAPAYAKD
jgi:hypothetical protein